MRQIVRPRAWSDFDGTGVEKLSVKNPRHWPRNMLKVGLAMVPGYDEFLGGIKSTGVELAGVASRRSNFFPRRMATNRSIAQLGLDQFFFHPDQIVLTGSEEAKGEFVMDQSREASVAMIEDNPHKFGAVLLGTLMAPPTHPDSVHHPILLGVVNHGRSQEYMRRLASQARMVTECELFNSQRAKVVQTDGGFSVEARALSLHVVQLQPYSEQLGQEFGQRLLDLATQFDRV